MKISELNAGQGSVEIEATVKELEEIKDINKFGRQLRLRNAVIEDDSEGEEQYELAQQFLDIKKEKKPNMIYRCLGDVDLEKWKKLSGIIADFHGLSQPVILRKPATMAIWGHSLSVSASSCDGSM